MNFGLVQKWGSYARFVLFICLVNIISANAWGKDITILALGDSLTAGYGLQNGASFPDQLQSKINIEYEGVKIINAGVSGDTTKGGLARLNWALADKPDVVIIELGANDGLRGLDPVLMEENLDQIIGRLKEKNIKVLLTGMLAPPNYGEEYGKQYNEVFPRLAKKHQVALYPFFLEGVAGISRLNQDDGIHPTKEGVAIIVERIYPYVKKVLN